MPFQPQKSLIPQFSDAFGFSFYEKQCAKVFKIQIGIIESPQHSSTAASFNRMFLKLSKFNSLSPWLLMTRVFFLGLNFRNTSKCYRLCVGPQLKGPWMEPLTNNLRFNQQNRSLIIFDHTMINEFLLNCNRFKSPLGLNLFNFSSPIIIGIKVVICISHLFFNFIIIESLRHRRFPN